MTGIIYRGAGERLIRFNLRVEETRYTRTAFSPRVHPIFPKTFSQHFRESFLSFPFLFLFFVIKVVGSSTNEDRYAVVNSVGRSNWTRRKVGQKGWEAGKLQSSTIVLCNLPVVASRGVEGWLNWTVGLYFPSVIGIFKRGKWNSRYGN